MKRFVYIAKSIDGLGSTKFPISQENIHRFEAKDPEGAWIFIEKNKWGRRGEGELLLVIPFYYQNADFDERVWIGRVPHGLEFK